MESALQTVAMYILVAAAAVYVVIKSARQFSSREKDAPACSKCAAAKGHKK